MLSPLTAGDGSCCLLESQEVGALKEGETSRCCPLAPQGATLTSSVPVFSKVWLLKYETQL